MNPVMVTLSVMPNNHEITLGFSEYIRGGGTLPWYTGDYEVTPRKVEQVLPTDNKGMRDDVTIHAIYRAEVINPSGGITVTIGNE